MLLNFIQAKAEKVVRDEKPVASIEIFWYDFGDDEVTYKLTTGGIGHKGWLVDQLRQIADSIETDACL